MRPVRGLLIVFTLAAACGGGDDSNTPPTDASPDSGQITSSCGTLTGQIAAYPAMLTGKTVGAGADLSVAMGACTDERSYYGDSGDDQVIELSSLTPGTTYVVNLTTTEDLSFYVTSACDGAMPTAGACLLHVDETTGNEQGEFVAPAGGTVYVVIDSGNDPSPPTSGDYTLAVRAAECTGNAQCTNAAEPFCSDFTCVQCLSSFDCTGSTPVCSANTCVGPGTMCTGDDTSEQDDGPSQATNVTVPTTGNPTVISNHAVCSTPGNEGDWYRIVLTTQTSLRIQMAWTDAASDLDFILYDGTGQALDGGVDSGAGPETVLAQNLAAGTYYVEVYEYEPTATAATGYTLTFGIPDCTTSFQCATTGAPVCDTGACVAGPAQCVGDDAADGGAGGDDGPANARDLTGAVGVAVPLTGKICNTPGTEFDWYKVTPTSGQGGTLNLAWTGTADLDVAAFDSTGRLLGLSFWLNPEVVTLTYLPGQTYYVRVANASAATTTPVDYTITATRTAAQTCATRTDCAATYSTQIYRGNCTGGACQFIPAGAGAANAPCDSADDCTSARCSYLAFESDAEKSVCTTTCTSTANCAAITGTACTTAFSTNICHPTCASDLQCGANTGSSTVDTGQPWNYRTCTSGACGPAQ